MSYPSPEQSAILSHLDGALLVLAPAGTGKTRVMADRLAAVIAKGMPPNHTLGVTFTNRAAEHMRAAVRESCGATAKECRIQTFHSLCAWILRQEAGALGLPADFVIYDNQDSQALMLECLPAGHNLAYFEFQKLARLKSECDPSKLTLDSLPALYLNGYDQSFQEICHKYHRKLAARGALDFADLLYHTRAMLELLPEKRVKWTRRFRWIQMDEVHDTHLSEYEIIRILSSEASSIAFFGDLDQTIYEWRGSCPEAVIARIRENFAPVTELSLRENYRSTRALLRFADQHAATYAKRHTHSVPAPSLAEGTPPEIGYCNMSSDEASFITDRVRDMRNSGEGGRIGVLARIHRRVELISDWFASRSIPHFTVDEEELHQSEEIQQLLARLRLISQPSDVRSLLCMIQRPRIPLGRSNLQEIREKGPPCGLLLTDLVRIETHQHGDPFHALLQALASGTVVIFDVETTGLSPAEDEVIDIGAVKVVAGRTVNTFEALLRPTRPLGESAAVHGISEETLHSHGRDPADVFREFARFAEGAVLVGHNVSFDLSMIHGHASRVGVALPELPSFDTLDLSRRLLDLDRHDLASVCEAIQARHRPCHRALADAEATADLLRHLAPMLAAGAPARRKLISAYGAAFLHTTEWLCHWRGLARTLRPPDLCRRILSVQGLSDSSPERGQPWPKTGLSRLFSKNNPPLHAPVHEPYNESKFQENSSPGLLHLIALLEYLDDPARPPELVLAELAAKGALSRHPKLLDPASSYIPVLTIHQAKGLEFDTVFIAGLTEGEFPNHYADSPDQIEEEKRLFHVAITRAKRHLVLSSHQVNDWGYSKKRSSFIAGIIK